MLLRTGKRFEMVFGPGHSPVVQSGGIGEVYESICAVDSGAVLLSAMSDGLRVIGTENTAAMTAGRAICGLYCRIYDRVSGSELTSEEERARAAAEAIPPIPAPIAVFDPRSSSDPRSAKRFTKLASARHKPAARV